MIESFELVSCIKNCEINTTGKIFEWKLQFYCDDIIDMIIQSSYKHFVSNEDKIFSSSIKCANEK